MCTGSLHGGHHPKHLGGRRGVQRRQHKFAFGTEVSDEIQRFCMHLAGSQNHTQTHVNVDDDNARHSEKYDV